MLESSKGERKKVILVYYVGGITYAEMSCYRYLSERLDNKVQFIVKKKQVYKPTMRYNDAGDIIKDDTGIFTNRPNYVMYNSTEEVFCIFCKESNRRKDLINIIGPLYGPIEVIDKTKEEYYMHELCAIWSPGVYIDSDTKKFKNLYTEIDKAKKLT